jgi:hypothetical protein
MALYVYICSLLLCGIVRFDVLTYFVVGGTVLWATESSSFSAGDRRKLRKLLNRKVDAEGHQTLNCRKLNMETVRPVECAMVKVNLFVSFPDTRTAKQK